MNKVKLKKLYRLILDLWEVRGYGIPERELYDRVNALGTGEIIGYRPCGRDGTSLVPDIKDGRISYTKYYE